VVAARLLAIANLHVLRERQYVVDAFAEAEVIRRSISPADKEAAALPHRVVAYLECFDSCPNLLGRVSMAFLQQILQHQLFILQKVEMQIRKPCVHEQILMTAKALFMEVDWGFNSGDQ
jgi:hypothetical protein